jgi:hypothetical protein
MKFTLAEKLALGLPLNSDEAAIYLGIHRDTLYDKCGRGQIQCSQGGAMGQGRLSFRKEWLDAYIDGQSMPVKKPKQYKPSQNGVQRLGKASWE